PHVPTPEPSTLPLHDALPIFDLDIGVPARGWTGEAYQGHIFWDELFIFPVFNHRMPEITRSLLMYRARRLGEAREAARRAGFRGDRKSTRLNSSHVKISYAVF